MCKFAWYVARAIARLRAEDLSQPAWEVDYYLDGTIVWSRSTDAVPAVGERFHSFTVVKVDVSSFGIVDVSLEWADNAPLLTL